MLSRRRQTDFCGSARCRASPVGPDTLSGRSRSAFSSRLHARVPPRTPRSYRAYHHTAWTTENGVSAVWTIQQAPNGFLWLTTPTGVFRFDGLRFESTDEVTNRQVHNADIVTVFPSPSGGVWLTTRTHGLLLWKDNRVTNYPDRRCTPAQGLNKGRAAILTSGHATKGAFWIDHDTRMWETSTYWMNELPPWAAQFNASNHAARARKDSGVVKGSFYEKVGRSPVSVAYQLEFAEALIVGEKLGKNPANVTDMITISISSTDINGHAFGPDDPSQKELIVQSDAALDSFFTLLDKTIGLKNVMVAMTGDHGVGRHKRLATRWACLCLISRQMNLPSPLSRCWNRSIRPGAKANTSCRWTILTCC
jgi:hypothetical protein